MGMFPPSYPPLLHLSASPPSSVCSEVLLHYYPLEDKALRSSEVAFPHQVWVGVLFYSFFNLIIFFTKRLFGQVC